MEVDGLGARCTLKTCRTLDYLPFTCPYCHQSYCDEHKNPADHSCPSPKAVSKTVPVCPLCNAPVPVPTNLTADIAVSRHIEQGCPKRHRTAPLCAHASCNVRDLSATRCPSCGKVFCLAHRLEADHACERVHSNSAKGPFGNRVGQQKDKPQSSKAVKERRKGDGVRRTDFANSRLKPLGDVKVDGENRVHVAVFFPAGSDIQPRYMFFSNRNSAGKIIDQLVKQFGVSQPRSGDRYSLYAVKENGTGVNLLPHITPLKDLPSGILQSGDALVMDIGEHGLDQAWLPLLRKAAVAERPDRFPKRNLGLRQRSSFRGREKAEKCAVA